MASARMSSRPSRLDMLRRGVPEDYVDALLDENYMQQLIVATGKQHRKRQQQRDRQDRLQKVILTFLICQALIGVWVALYKTYLQPDKVISAFVSLENIDMVLMMDTSNHMKERRDQQHEVVLHFSQDMSEAMHEQRKQLKQKNIERVQAMKEKDSTAFSRFLSRILVLDKPEDRTGLSGGRLRFATGTFNRQSKALHAFTNNLTLQKEALSEVTAEHYESFTHLNQAMARCVESFQQVKKPNTRKFCVLIGDNEAMCQKPQAKRVDDFCSLPQNRDLCPPELANVGAPIEYSYEFDSCKDIVQTEFGDDIKLIMMFTVSSKEDEQMRLRNPTFRNFVQNTTNCSMEKITRIEQKNGYNATVVEYVPIATTCVRFILGHGLQDVLEKSQRIVQLLQSSVSSFEEPNEKQDYRYLAFLLLVLNLLLYLGASAIARWYASFQNKAARVMGTKKKMIKVTKTLVEKPARRASVVDRFAAQLTEVELAEVSNLRPAVKLGAPHTVRARLKGGCLRHNVQQGVADGHGTPFDPNAFWTFEPISPSSDQSDMVMEAKQPVHIKNQKGDILCIGEGGQTHFMPAAEAASVGQAAEFVVCPMSGAEDNPARLGENVRILSAATQKYLRVKKEGDCDASGTASETETQFVIDQGGQSAAPGGIYTFRSEATTDAMLHGNPNGSAQVASGKGTWAYWLVERTGSTTSQSSDSKDGAVDSQSLRIGDIVTIKALNSQALQVEPGTSVTHTGNPNAEMTSAIPEGAAAASTSSAGDAGIQEFVVERVGMGLVHLHDSTIRRGANVCFKPYDRTGEGHNLGYLKVNDDGSITSNGKATQPEIGFVIEAGSINNMLAPLGAAMSQGDVDLLVAPLWNKSDVKHYDALSSSWTNDEELSRFKGNVVVASAQGTYTVPKAAGEGSQEWVAVVDEGVDLRKAATQAKKQGATGLIIRCEQALSLEKLAHSADDEDPPELPAVFVTKKVGEALNERGIVLKGCEFKKKYMTEVMRNLGRLGGPGLQQTDKYKNVFQAIGTAILENEKEKAKAPKQAVPKVAIKQETSQGKFKWKVNTNTQYIWSGSGGGATTMQVNYGLKAPPSAMKKKVVEGEDGNETAFVDASADIVPEADVHFRRSVVGSAMVPVEDFKAHTLAQELSEVLLDDEGTAQAQAQEQLSDESDFMIEYNFTEVEVAVSKDTEQELDSDEEVMDEGTVVSKVGVPRRFFWIVAMFLVVSTTALGWLLYSNLSSEIQLPDEFRRHADMDDEDIALLDAPVAADLPPMQFLAHRQTW
mmetsp:Transcript_45459/g.106229  ORF Transcript_45459/g.106229 Transcript_45459/m.106229 type:complete len:1277 (+) Transcript_45459:2-3832(+)